MPMSSTQAKPKKEVLSATEQLIETNPVRIMSEPAAKPQWSKKELKREEVRLRVRKKLTQSLQEAEQQTQLSDEQFEDSDIDDEFYNATLRKKDRKKKRSIADFNELQKEEMARKGKIEAEEKARREAELQEEMRRKVAEDGMNTLLAMIKGEEDPEEKNDKDDDDGDEENENDSVKDEKDSVKDDQGKPKKDQTSSKKEPKKKKKDTFKKPFDIEAESPIIFPDEQTYDDFSRFVSEFTKENGVTSPSPTEDKSPGIPDRTASASASSSENPSPFSITIADELMAMISNSSSPARTPPDTKPAKKKRQGYPPSVGSSSPASNLQKTQRTEVQQSLFNAQVTLLEAKRLLSPHSK